MNGRLDDETRRVIGLLAQVSRQLLVHGVTDAEAFADALHAALKTGSPLPLDRAAHAFATLAPEWRRMVIDTLNTAIQRGLSPSPPPDDRPEDDRPEPENTFWSLLPVLQPSGITARDRLRAEREHAKHRPQTNVLSRSEGPLDL
ncbi:hypothetical protein [Azospirillum soli]|uniref:hypothetical protein n=1 Tax=Azospirillum soli TaxID=1304799 RepID=UPI001AE52B1E|nr:hypothetical protein [Azospirillum soli]MBP2314700.1 hypothetical protein [Azospirillum soli]